MSESHRLQPCTPGILTGNYKGIFLVRRTFFHATSLESLTLPQASPSSQSPILFRPVTIMTTIVLSLRHHSIVTPAHSRSVMPVPLLPKFSRHPFLCHLEEHVQYTEVKYPLSGYAQDDSFNFLLLPQKNWFHTEVRAFLFSH